MTRVAVLGATGSIGSQTLEVLEHLGVLADGDYPQLGRWVAQSVSGANAVDELKALAERCQPEAICCEALHSAALTEALGDGGPKVLAGEEGLRLLASDPAADIVVIAIYGLAALGPLLTAISAGKRIALASKEALVAAGGLIRADLARSEARIFPVDSEHSALFQCLGGRPPREVRRVVLTCSGGPFRGMAREQLAGVSYEQALKHPVWSMGAGITINSATLFNKGLEMLEAKVLFGLAPEQIEVLVHPQGLIHGIVEFTDGSVLAQAAQADMRLPIQYALTAPWRYPSLAAPLEIPQLAAVSLDPPDYEAFPALQACKLALQGPWWLPGALVAANEELCKAFQAGLIGFNAIGDSLLALAESSGAPFAPGADEDGAGILLIEQAARKWAADRIKG